MTRGPTLGRKRSPDRAACVVFATPAVLPGSISDDDVMPVGLIDPAGRPDPGAPLDDTRAMEQVKPFRDQYNASMFAEFAEDLLWATAEDEENAELDPAAKLMLRADG